MIILHSLNATLVIPQLNGFAKGDNELSIREKHFPLHDRYVCGKKTERNSNNGLVRHVGQNGRGKKFICLYMPYTVTSDSYITSLRFQGTSRGFNDLTLNSHGLCSKGMALETGTVPIAGHKFWSYLKFL